MPWELYIHTIDVGQGESALLVARDPGGLHRTMLIDGGLPGYAATVHQYVAAQLLAYGIATLDHILVSHYDDDHAGGVIGLLVADNLSQLATMMTPLVAAAAQTGTNRVERIACAALAVTAITGGVYNSPAHPILAAQIAVMCTNLRQAGLPANLTDYQAAGRGINYAANNLPAQTNASLPLGARNGNQLARFAGFTAANAIATPGATPLTVETAVGATVRQRLMSQLPPALRFTTNGLYTNAHLIDIGNTGHISQVYLNAINGQFTNLGGWRIAVPGTNRTRTTAALTAEILWNTGVGAAPAPANSPAVFVVAANSNVWDGTGVPQVIHTGQPENDDSIGLIVRFNDFFFYTGGDLPSAGEDIIATAVTTVGLPNPAGGTFNPAGRIASFKCGHHGSGHSTSTAFLNAATPVTAVISCGRNQFGIENHPNQAMVNRLYASTVANFYLTNCKYITTGIPASNGVDQLTVLGNRSRVAGDNNDNNLVAGRQRGTIDLGLNQAQSLANGVPHQFRMRYFDNDDAPGGGGALVGLIITAHLF